eukprot:3941019-Rhodomonas_salina.5
MDRSHAPAPCSLAQHSRNHTFFAAFSLAPPLPRRFPPARSSFPLGFCPGLTARVALVAFPACFPFDGGCWSSRRCESASARNMWLLSFNRHSRSLPSAWTRTHKCQARASSARRWKQRRKRKTRVAEALELPPQI